MTISFDDLDTNPNSITSAMAIIRKEASIVNGGEAALVDCPKCNGTGQTRWGVCFRCQNSKVAGKVTVRSAAASKAVVTRRHNEQAAMDAFIRDHMDVLTFLADNESWSDFFRSLHSQLKEMRPLTENQLAAVRRSMDKIAARKAEKAASREAGRPVVDISAIQQLFANVTPKLAKRPVFRTETFEIQTDKVVGHQTLWIKDTEQDKFVAKIESGKFVAFRASTPATLPAIEAVAADPTAAVIAFARKFKRCACCGLALRNPVSVVAVVGPICAEKWGLDHLRISAAEALAAEKAEEIAA
jgi:ribosomal protein L17